VLRGSHSPRLVFVAENPSADDDLTGIPFSGARGELLDRMIGAMGLDPNADVAVILVTKCFAGDGDGGRASSPAQLAACSSYLHAQLALLAPKAVVALGEVAAVALVGGALGAPPRGEWKAYRGRLPVMPTLALSTFSESADARAKQAKKLVWDDLQKVMDHLGLPRKRQ
jgi:DNA polymerase